MSNPGRRVVLAFVLWTSSIPAIMLAADAPQPSSKGVAAVGASPWIDKRLPADEHATLAEVEGFAPPAFGDDTKWAADSVASFDDLRGKVVVIQSWTHKTEPGRGAIQRVPVVLKDIPADDLRIIYLHTPEGCEDAQAYVSKRSIDAPVLIDTTGRLCDDLGVYKRPITMVLDKSGAVRYAGVSIVSLPDAVKALLAEPFDAKAAKPAVVATRDKRDGVAPPPAADAGEKPAATKAEFPKISGQISTANDKRGKKGPGLNVKTWVTKKPETDGKVVMVEFWATWCGPCKMSIPHLNELHTKYSDQLAIVGVSDEDPAKIRGFMQSTKFKYAVASDPNLSNNLGIRGIPHAYIMSPDGIVRWQGNPLSLEEATVKQIIDASGVTASKDAAKSDVKRWRTAAAPAPSSTEKPS